MADRGSWGVLIVSAVLLGAVLLLPHLSGCSSENIGGSVGVQGSMDAYGHTVRTGIRVDLSHGMSCTVVDVEVDGMYLVAGYLKPLSEEGCSEYFRPFRLGPGFGGSELPDRPAPVGVDGGGGSEGAAPGPAGDAATESLTEPVPPLAGP